MLTVNIQVYETEDKNLKVTYKMREICGPLADAIYEEYEMQYGTGFSAEELIASCAADGSLDFYKKHGKRSELVYIKVEDAER